MVGKTIAHYKILGELGEGGMGQVYRAEDTELRRQVAIKVLPPDVADSPERLERFRREAQAVAALNHPNIVTIYSVEESDGVHFLTMELVEGQSLDQLLSQRGMSLDKFFDLAVPMVDAVRAAHQRGIVHRDLKPKNVMVDEEGRVKILDFGLAKLEHDPSVPEMSQLATEALTQEGVVVGTVPYMSPEQIESKPIDARSDIFSLGIVLHEMATGRRPFQGDSGPALMSSILKDEPPAVSEIKQELPRHMGRIVRHCLEKDPNRRFQTTRDLHNELEELREEVRSGVELATGATPVLPAERRLGRRVWIVGGAAVALITVAIALWLPFRAGQRIERARALLPEVERLATAGSFADAYELAIQAEPFLPDDPELERWMPEIGDSLTITTQPEGASVYLQQMPSDPEESSQRVLVGTTPMVDQRIPRADHRVWLEKEDFEPLEQVVSSALNRDEGRLAVEPDIVLEVLLQPAGSVPAGMVFVPGSEYTLRGSGVRGMAAVELDDFFVDRYEVSNEQYREFIRAGGYSNPSYWQLPFVKDGVEIPFAEAMDQLVDRSGLPGPREWSNQEFPDGRSNHPVTGVSWYEAAAYAEYAGKTLPTIYQWEKAARAGRWTHFEGMVMPWGLMRAQGSSARRANYFGRDTVPVDSYPYGVSPYGAYNMAGNVEEWCLNERGPGRMTAGGSWADAHYLFPTGGARPPFDASNTIGFRCVSKPAADAADQGSGRIEPQLSTIEVKPVDDTTYQGFLSYYRYDKKPGTAELIQTIDTPDWTREKLTFAGVGDNLVIAYLYLPKRAKPPYQCINYVSSSTVISGRTVAEEVGAILAPQIKAGRAVMAVVPKYALERNVPRLPPPDQRGPVWTRNAVLAYVAEFRMGLDYLETREEIDTERISHIGFSWGAVGSALILNAVEPRIRSAILIGGGLYPSDRLPDVNAVNFVPRITQSVLVLTGKYDEETPYEPNARLLFEQLRAPKQLELVDSGHLPPVEIRNPIISEFLDETLGPVNRSKP